MKSMDCQNGEVQSAPFAQNVIITHNDEISLRVIFKWINDTLQCDLTAIDELRNGAVYCQLMHRLYPKSISMFKVRFTSCLEFEYVQNFKLLQAAFDRMGVVAVMPVKQMTEGKLHPQFLQWFYKFFQANKTDRPYNAVTARFFAEIGMRKSPIKWKSCLRSSANDLSQMSLAGRPLHQRSVSLGRRIQLIPSIPITRPNIPGTQTRPQLPTRSVSNVVRRTQHTVSNRAAPGRSALPSILRATTSHHTPQTFAAQPSPDVRLRDDYRGPNRRQFQGKFKRLVDGINEEIARVPEQINSLYYQRIRRTQFPAL